MAKMKIVAGILSALALCLASCTVDGPESDTGSVAARICAGVGTRADGANWTQDEIGVTVKKSESSASTMPSDYRNVPYVTKANEVKEAEFTAVSGEIYFDGPSKTTFTAYAPYEETTSVATLPGTDGDGVITRSTAEYQKEQTKIDFLFASEKTASSSSPNVNFVFDHKMSQIILNISAGVGVDVEGDNGIESGEYTLAGLCHSGTFNVTTGETATVEEAEGTGLELSKACTAKTLSDPDSGISYTLVVYPQSPEDLPFSATVGGKEYSGSLVIPTSADNDSQTDGFAAGYSYTYNITISENGLIITECVIDKWIDADTEWGNYGPIGQFVYPDTEFTVIFNSAPSFGTSGKVSIYKYDDDTDPVDVLDVADLACLDDCSDITTYSYNTSMDILHANPSDKDARYRVVWYKSLEINGNTLTIRPHSCVLDYGTKYYITIDNSAVEAMSFTGIGEKEWVFTTREKPDNAKNLMVGRTGYDVDCRTIQYALSYVCANSAADDAVTVTVLDGTYEEQLYMYSKNNVTVRSSSTISSSSVGSDGGVKILYSTSEDDGSNNVSNTASGNGASLTAAPKVGDTDLIKSGGMYVMFLENCSGIRFENIYFENTFSGHRVQAGAVNFSGDSNDSSSNANFSGTAAFVNCTVQGRQAVIFTEGYNWFSDCLIGGNVDYIWGYARISLFEKCELQSQRDLLTGSYRDIVQARTRNADDLGYVLLDCDLTNDSVAETDNYYTYIARSPGSSSTYDNVACIGCVVKTSKMAGWYIMRNTETGALSGVPNPAEPDALHGWRYYNFTDENGDTVDVSAWSEVAESNNSVEDFADYVYEIKAEDDADDLAVYESRSTIFGHDNNCPEGWYDAD